MRKLISVIVALLTIASGSYSQSKPDTICLPKEDALRKVRQADSLETAKAQISEQKYNISLLNSRIVSKDSTIAGLKGEMSITGELVASKNRELKDMSDKFKLANDRGNDFNKRIKRANTRTIFGTIIGAAIPIVITLIKNRK